MTEHSRILVNGKHTGTILESEEGQLFYQPNNKFAPQLRIVCWDRYDVVSKPDWRKFYNPSEDERFNCNLCLGWVRRSDDPNRVWVYTVSECHHDN